MKRKITATLMLLSASMAMMAQTRASDSTPKAPQGATYALSDGSTVTKTAKTISSETPYYNVVQVTKGSLTLDGCTLSKTGEGTSGDNSSFYGTNSAVYASGSDAVINVSSDTVSAGSDNKVVVEVGPGVIWQLTADTDVNTLVNNGTIVTNGYRLNVSGSSSGTGTISETTGISSVSAAADDDNAPRYTFDGRRVTSTTKGIIIQDGKKFIHR